MLGGTRCSWLLLQGTPKNIVGRFCAIPRLLSLRRMPNCALTLLHASLVVRADQKFAPRNSMLNADHRFSGFAMRIEEDECSYTNHQNDVTYYNMVNQHKIQNSLITAQNSSTSTIHYNNHWHCQLDPKP